ncbi:TY-Chap domain-containing protein [Catenuloplanes japonicus]|uniref:TY-Chap domain-containing protein n=1 Tax=Catenuloplanes japonicus TaxID=33876 RepID=UPI000525D115|nr:hypothetical protein [Catenuloplanes japonicus]
MSLTWERLEAELGARLPSLQWGDTVILAAGEPYPYVQFSQFSERLWVDASSLRWLPPEQRLPPETDAALAELGWTEPDGSPDAMNWSRHEPWPFTSATGASIAQLLVRTLRDVFGAQGADQLLYRIWRDPGGQELDWPFLHDLRPYPPPKNR